MIKKLYFFSLFLLYNLAFSQQDIPFSIRYQNSIQGDLIFIANNIMNRKNANEEYNKINDNSKLNDEFDMVYIDIDNDPSTFSSSSATIEEKKNANEIVFAGLYWSATYKYKNGFKNNGVFTSEGEREANFNEIKIKTPGQNDYQNISGSIIFDGSTDKRLKSTSPYVCFYDLTEMVKSKPFGEYTVANIKSTQGFIEGGVAGGWVIYFVYKNEMSVKKQVTLYDGFTYIYNKPVDLNLSGFLTPRTGNINAKIALAALEGDSKIDGDNVRIKSTVNNRYFLLGNQNRLGSNFFNGQITIGEEHFLNRKPASLNCLGFDALLFPLDNKNNKIISNDAIQTTLKFASAGDKVYLFSMAFCVDLDEAFFEKNRKDAPVKQVGENLTALEANKQKNNYPTYTLKTERHEPRILKDVRKLGVKSNLKQGYYIVANVFGVEENAKNYRQFLTDHNLKSDFIKNPENNFTYVYLKYFENIEEAQKAYDSNLENTFFDDYWILAVEQ
jgi:hypothetical protein